MYLKDFDLDNSDFTGWTGDPDNLFISPYSESITNSSTDNPKSISIAFNRTIKSLQVGLGENNGGDFSNVKISLVGSGGAIRSLFDDSTNSTKLTSLNAQFENDIFNSILIEFYTSDPVSLSNVSIPKSSYNSSQIQGRTDAGNFVNLAATNNGNFKVSVQEYGDTPSIDAFARLRVSENYTIFDSKQIHDKQPLFWDEALGGAATSVHSITDAATTLNVTASAADYAIRQTKQRFNYQPGKSQLIFLTFRCACQSGVTKRIGTFTGTGVNNMTPNNGIFFETNGIIPAWGIAKAGSITEDVIQSSWNVDTLDGSGDQNNPSGILLDLDAVQIAIIDYEWLGVGRVRVGFVINGVIIYCHYFNHANDSAFQSVYMSTPNLPLRLDIQSDGTASSELTHICGTVISEGGIQKTGILRSVDTGTSHINAAIADTIYAVVGIRLKNTHLDVTVIPESFSMISETNDDFRWSVCLNPTIAGTYTFIDLVNSSVQYAIGDPAGTNTVSDEGIRIASGFASTDTLSADQQLQTALRIGSTIAGARDELVLCVTPLSPGADIQASLNFRELL
ncbi:MAG: hypothetical protein KJP07_13575 [Desulfatitalea sp.]|nr:hypothetical protein [Desulfatitalea sp.]